MFLPSNKLHAKFKKNPIIHSMGFFFMQKVKAKYINNTDR